MVQFSAFGLNFGRQLFEGKGQNEQRPCYSWKYFIVDKFSDILFCLRMENKFANLGCKFLSPPFKLHDYRFQSCNYVLIRLASRISENKQTLVYCLHQMTHTHSVRSSFVCACANYNVEFQFQALFTLCASLQY